jgi:hypothetical protein
MTSPAEELASATVALIANLIDNNRPDLPRRAIAAALIQRGAGQLVELDGRAAAARVLRAAANRIDDPPPVGTA